MDTKVGAQSLVFHVVKFIDFRFNLNLSSFALIPYDSFLAFHLLFYLKFQEFLLQVELHFLLYLFQHQQLERLVAFEQPTAENLSSQES